jgi:hypothetical protein
MRIAADPPGLCRKTRYLTAGFLFLRGGTEFGEVEGKPSLVTVEFLQRGDRTELVLTHSRFATVESRDSHAQGWAGGVENFARFVEKE